MDLLPILAGQTLRHTQLLQTLVTKPFDAYLPSIGVSHTVHVYGLPILPPSYFCCHPKSLLPCVPSALLLINRVHKSSTKRLTTGSVDFPIQKGRVRCATVFPFNQPATDMVQPVNRNFVIQKPTLRSVRGRPCRLHSGNFQPNGNNHPFYPGGLYRMDILKYILQENR